VCGIVGVVHFRAEPRTTPETLVDMRDSMSHRGPDGAGLWFSDDRSVLLGHRRLSIIDLSAAAAQPMTNEDGTIEVTYNGEIYNHVELRRQLIAAGHRFRTDHSDTETIVHGYEQWGIDGLAQRLSGDYAIGIWDSSRRQLHLVRDRIGVKPLYFAIRSGLLAFASEIKALLRHPAIEPDLEPPAMYHYLTFLTTPAPMTMFRGIFKLPPATVLSVGIGDDAPRISRYWDAVPGRSDLPQQVRGLDAQAAEDIYVAAIRAALTRAVDRRMMSDVPFGVFLSGGIDSSTNVALMAGLMNRPVDTFTVGFKDHTHLNELEHARHVARHFRTNHHEVLVDESDMVGYLDQLIHTQDEPIADWVCIPLYFVSRLARESGTTVVQVGEGSDEQFCGYGTYMMYLKLYERYWRPFRRLVPAPLRSAVAGLATQAAKLRPSLGMYADFVDRAATGREHFWTGAHVFWNVIKRELVRAGSIRPSPDAIAAAGAGLLDPSYLEPESFNVVKSFVEPFDRQFPGQDVLTRMIYQEFRLRLPELLLMRVDKIGMSTSIEARVPFLDHELVELTMDIPMSAKVRNGKAKHLLKRAVTGWIPDEIINRPKMGFGAPMAQWLRGEFGVRVERDLLASSLIRGGYFQRDFIARLCAEHRSGRRDWSLYVWSLFNLVAWFDYWVDGRRQ
jgi:asparagine synthase (glutamine-hydrolysing)